MKIYVTASEYDDYGFGYDSNGEAISQSTVEELYRLANNEVLPNTDLFNNWGCEIDEDSFRYYATGTAFGAYVEYLITMYLNSDDININDFATGRDSSLVFNYSGVDTEFELEVHIKIKSSNVASIEIVEADAYEDGVHSTFYSNKMSTAFDFEAICNYIRPYAESAAIEIHQAVSNI